ncbi:uncharacterized protein LOC115219547 [Octopus sinensis]|uniref:Uncharacterized protein LOC115219547 n=1 Tax=Octopus sinensis TaxID=2607531 RepID=A0A6P7T5Q4_9MOLL|nr:uncharacterized protein LOC115219547 [Octopus sinensis]
MKLLTVFGFVCVLIFVQDNLVLTNGYVTDSDHLSPNAALLAKALCTKDGEIDVKCYRDKLLLSNGYAADSDDLSPNTLLAKALCTKDGETDDKCYRDISLPKEWGSVIKRAIQKKGLLERILQAKLNDQRSKRFFSDW